LSGPERERVKGHRVRLSGRKRCSRHMPGRVGAAACAAASGATVWGQWRQWRRLGTGLGRELAAAAGVAPQPHLKRQVCDARRVVARVVKDVKGDKH
jgi:hypothetical protein